MSVQKRIRLVSSQGDEFPAEAIAMQEARGRIEAENAVELAGHARARAEAQARAIAERKLCQENDLLALIEARSKAELQLLNEVNIRCELEKELITAANEKKQLEISLVEVVKQKLNTEKQLKIDLEKSRHEELQAQAEFIKNATLKCEAATLAQEKSIQEEKIFNVIQDKIDTDKKALSLLEGKLIAEIARAEGAKRVLQQRQETLTLLLQAELEEKELMLFESQAKNIAQGKIESVRELKITVQKRVEVELLAALGIEMQLHAEEEALSAASSHVEISALAKQAAEGKFKKENEYAQQAERNLIADQIAEQELDHKLQLINERIKLAEKNAGLLLAERLAEEQKLALDNAVFIAEAERIEIEKEAVDALNKRLLLQDNLTILAQQHLQAENCAIEEISMRMETELKAIDSDNARISLEAGAREIMEAQLRVTEEIVSAAKKRGENEVIALRMAKLRAESEAQAAQAESDLMQAHTYANKLANQRKVAAQNLQKFIDERVQDEQFYLELEQRKCDAEVRECSLAKSRVEAGQRCLNEIEARIAVEKQAELISNQRQIAEQLMRQLAQAKWKSEKQAVLDLHSGLEAHIKLMPLSGLNKSTELHSVN